MSHILIRIAINGLGRTASPFDSLRQAFPYFRGTTAHVNRNILLLIVRLLTDHRLLVSRRGICLDNIVLGVVHLIYSAHIIAPWSIRIALLLSQVITIDEFVLDMVSPVIICDCGHGVSPVVIMLYTADPSSHEPAIAVDIIR